MKISKFLYVLIFFFLYSCSSSSLRKNEPLALNKAIKSEPIVQNVKRNFVDYKARPFLIRPGEVVKLELKDPFPKDEGTVICRNKKIPLNKSSGLLVFYVSESYFSKLNPFKCNYESDSGDHIELAHFDVVAKKFPFEKLNVDKKKVFFSKKDLKRIIKEKRNWILFMKMAQRSLFLKDLLEHL